MKLFLTVAVLMILLALFRGVDRGDRGATDMSAWRGGSTDIFRVLIVRPDGSLRKSAKPLVAALLIAFLGVAWLLM